MQLLPVPAERIASAQDGRRAGVPLPAFMLQTLRELAGLQRHCARGFDSGAGQATDERLRALLKESAGVCLAAAAELEQLIAGTPAAAHALVLPGPGRRRRPDPGLPDGSCGDAGLIDGCELGGSRVLEAYRNALDDPLPPSVRMTVLRQFEQAVTAHEALTGLATALTLAGARRDPPGGTLRPA